MRLARRTVHPLYREFADMQRLFDDMFTSRPGVRAWRPSMDVYRTEDAVVVEAELPGLDVENDLDVDVEDGVLTISGKLSSSKTIEEEGMYLSERRFGSFQRQVTLPEGVDVDAVGADYQDGVLKVTAPLPVEVLTESRKIPVATVAAESDTVGEPEATEKAS